MFNLLYVWPAKTSFFLIDFLIEILAHLKKRLATPELENYSLARQSHDKQVIAQLREDFTAT